MPTNAAVQDDKATPDRRSRGTAYTARGKAALLHPKSEPPDVMHKKRVYDGPRPYPPHRPCFQGSVGHLGWLKGVRGNAPGQFGIFFCFRPAGEAGTREGGVFFLSGFVFSLRALALVFWVFRGATTRVLFLKFLFCCCGLVLESAGNSCPKAACGGGAEFSVDFNAVGVFYVLDWVGDPGGSEKEKRQKA